MTNNPITAALAYAAQLDKLDLDDDTLNAIGDLAGGLGWDLNTRVVNSLAHTVSCHCETAADDVFDEAEFPARWRGMGGNDPDSGISAELQTRMDDAREQAAEEWLREAQLIMERQPVLHLREAA